VAIRVHRRGDRDIAEVYGDSPCISAAQDVLDLMGSMGSPCPRLWILNENTLAPAFFELRTGLAGDVLQKLSNYGLRAAIVCDYDRFTSESLRAFIRESNRGGDVVFANTFEEAETRLLRG
jgi:hypothetical protein